MKNKLQISIVGTNGTSQAMAELFGDAERFDRQAGESAPSLETPDFVIETENLDLRKKQAALEQIEQLAGEHTLILTSILGVSATQAASWLRNPSRLVGYAAFGDLRKTGLIELTAALQTDPAWQERADALIHSAGKETEWITDETGAVFPRILSMIINEAAFTWMEKAASAEDIDMAMRKGTNYPMGPLAWADEIGLDDVYAVLTGLHRDLGEDRYRPAPILRKLVHAGWLGKKTGRGFYTYAGQMAKELVL